MILSIIFLVLFAGFIGVNIYFLRSLIRSAMIDVDFKSFFLKNALLVGGAVICFLVASFGFYQWMNVIPDFIHVFQLVLGCILFIGGLLVAINCFVIHYYGKNIPNKLDKLLFIFIIVGFTVSAFSLFIYTNGLSIPQEMYPLVSGISFTEGFVSPKTGSPNIAFYALCIIGGAVIVYFVCDHIFYKEYGKHGLLESTFYVSFPAGIIGARIWYVVGNWSVDFAGEPFWKVFAIWEGGLTILGGAIMGIVVGVLFFMWRNKNLSIWFAVDAIVPTILIAQAVGRWGNFFNCEVHGLVAETKYFWWLPEIVLKNAQYSSAAPSLIGTNYLYVPLFFIECITNLFGYFLIAHVFGKLLGKYHEPGDLCFGYVIWYGLTRVLMEPLRYSEFKMGENGYWSWVWSMIFVFAGSLLIVANHIVRYMIKKKSNTFIKDSPNKRIIFAGVYMNIKAFIGTALVALAIVLMILNPFKKDVAYTGFNIGLICLVCGLSLLISLIATALTMKEAFTAKHLISNEKQPEVVNE